MITFARMSKVYTTEITSDAILSDNPLHQRLLKAYIAAVDHCHGDVLEVGCGEGRGIPWLLEKASTFTAIDKLGGVLYDLQKKYPAAKFNSVNIPPFSGVPDNAFDVVVSFQVIEHIQQDHVFLEEIRRVLRPGGIALITTPNRKMTLTRNPWHVREYLAGELTLLAKKYFSSVDMKGITGNEKVMAYYERNKKSVQRITRWDFLKLQYRLPASLLRMPYEILNRWNRNKLQFADDALVRSIHHSDYLVTPDAEQALDLFLIARK